MENSRNFLYSYFYKNTSPQKYQKTTEANNTVNKTWEVERNYKMFVNPVSQIQVDIKDHNCYA